MPHLAFSQMHLQKEDNEDENKNKKKNAKTCQKILVVTAFFFENFSVSA